MIDRIVIKSKKEVVIIYIDKPCLIVYSDVDAALYRAVELLELDKETPCTTSIAV